MLGTGGEAGNNREEQKTATARKGKKQNDLTTIRISLASSAELEKDRDEFDLYFRQQNDHLKNKASIWSPCAGNTSWTRCRRPACQTNTTERCETTTSS